MGFAKETGYTLPGGDRPLVNARILHAGNRFSIKSITSSAEAAATFADDNVDEAMTAKRWRPFANALSSPATFGAADWTATNLTVGSDNLTLTETSATGEHRIQQAYTFTAVEHVVAFRVQRQTAPEIQVHANDGTTDFTCFFDLRDGSVGTAANCTGQIVDLGDNAFLCSIYFTPLAATGFARLRLSNGSETVSYAGDTGNTIRALTAYLHASAATLRLDTFTALEGDVFCIAAHNLGRGAGRITFQHDSNADDTFTTIDSLSPTDNSPIMFLFEPITSGRWQVQIDRGVMPEVGVIRVGKLLQMERAIHQGHRPFKNNRDTAVRGNLSEGGEWLGRSTIRQSLSGALDWKHLTPGFVASALEGYSGLIQAMEREPAFIAWRPDTYADADYCWTVGPVAGPVFSDSPNLSTFSLGVQAYGWE